MPDRVCRLQAGFIAGYRPILLTNSIHRPDTRFRRKLNRSERPRIDDRPSADVRSTLENGLEIEAGDFFNRIGRQPPVGRVDRVRPRTADTTETLRIRNS